MKDHSCYEKTILEDQRCLEKKNPNKLQMAHITDLKKRRLQDYGFNLEYRTRWYVAEEIAYQKT